MDLVVGPNRRRRRTVEADGAITLENVERLSAWWPSTGVATGKAKRATS
jgi:hypothetical protein